MDIYGHCDERFARVRDAFERNFTEHGDIGASCAVTVDGEYVVDLWAGHQDKERTTPWDEDTIVCVYSTTKTMTFLAALMLADRGELDLYGPVVKYWPEYGQNGKEATKVCHFLSHSAGVPGFEPAIKGDDIYDWDLCVKNLAAQKPWWKIGEESGYHAATQGFLVGELVRRITGKSFGTFFREEVAKPLGADFHVGVEAQHLHRIGDMIPDATPLPEDNPFAKVEPGSVIDRLSKGMEMDDDAANSTAWRQAEIPAANGHGNARSVVRAQTPLVNGGSAFGVRLLSAGGCRRALEEQIEGVDHVFLMKLKFGMGYVFPNEMLYSARKDCGVFFGGAGGSSIVLDFDRHLCLSYVMNRMSNSLLGDPRAKNVGGAAYDCLD